MKRFLAYLLIIVLGIAVGFLLRGWVVGVTCVLGQSMNDTLVNGDYALVTRCGNAPQRGDIVQLELPERGGAYIKRVIGLPGDTVEIIGGNVHINGSALYENYATLSDDDYYIELGDDEYFVLGDNRPVSYDSREEDFGVVSASCFRGRVRAILWPVSRIDFSLER